MVSPSCFGTTDAARPPALKNLIILKRRDGGVVSTSYFGTTNAARPPTLKNLIILKRRDGGVVERARLEIVLRATVRGFESLSLRQ